MTKLIGREEELAEMERRFRNPNIRTLAIWGRRRVGKTALIQRFVMDKRHILLTAIEHSLNDSLRAFDESINAFNNTKDGGRFAKFTDVLKRLVPIGKHSERTVIVIDEYTYLCEEDPATNSYLQVFIDHDLQDMNAMLIICGSSIKMMENIFTDGKGALYRRFIGPMKILPLTYDKCRPFHPNMNEADRMRIYALIGGIPLYHLMMDDDTVEECVKNNFLGTYAPLREEADFIIARELDPVSTNLGILKAISDGHVTRKEIAEATGMSEENVIVNLKKMETIGVVSPLNPMCGANRKEKIYRITDNLVRLSNEILMPFVTAVSGQDREYGYETILPYLQTFYGPAFEDICAQYVTRHRRCKAIGSWWGKAGGVSTDIDIVALCEDGGNEYHLLCECKFRNKESGIREMMELENTSRSLKDCYNRRFCMFSRSGFTDELIEYAESRGIELLTPETMEENDRS
ncbi:MAG: AAA family ATPase [Candidatus Methanomethylophilaceae archaeon]|nr:AAA family ATPase [Candidatus Methanomethylophilaceae archaeon]